MGNILDCSTSSSVGVEEVSIQQPVIKENSGPLVIEEKKPLLESVLWKIQRSIFESVPNEFSSKSSVSFSLSSNCYVAKCYASIIMSYVLDWYADCSHDISEPIYILDIGAGLGKLGYLIMFRLFEMKEFWPESSHPPFIYVLSELSNKYVHYWEKNPLISQFVQLGYMDYGVFDAECDSSIHLIHSDKHLSPSSLKVPPFVICSSIFSYIAQDVVLVENNSVKSALLSVLQYTQTPFENELDSYDFSWSYQTMPLDPCYHSLINPSQRKDGHYIVPIKAITIIKTLLSWCNSQGVFLICDRGTYSDNDITVVKDPTISKVRAFSLPLNFFILEEFCQQQGGNCRISSLHEEYRCGLFSFNLPKSSLSRTYLAYHTQCTNFTIQSYYQLQKALQDESVLSFRSLLCLIRLSQYDPDIYYHYRHNITTTYPLSQRQSDNDILVDLDHIRDHIYAYVKNHDVSFELARMYMGLEDYTTAIELFEDSVKHVEPHAVTWYNIGLCALYLNNVGYAKQCFVYSLKLNPKYTAAQQKLSMITGVPAKQ